MHKPFMKTLKRRVWPTQHTTFCRFVSSLSISAAYSQSPLLKSVHKPLDVDVQRLTSSNVKRPKRAVKCTTLSDIQAHRLYFCPSCGEPARYAIRNTANKWGFVNIGHNWLTEPYKTSCGKEVWSSMLQCQDEWSRNWKTVHVSKRGEHGQNLHSLIRQVLCLHFVSS